MSPCWLPLPHWERAGVRAGAGDETARQHAHHVQDGIALGAVLCGGLVDQDGVGIVLPVGGDDVCLVARVVETGGCQRLIACDGCAVHHVDDDCLPLDGLRGRGERFRQHLLESLFIREQHIRAAIGDPRTDVGRPDVITADVGIRHLGRVERELQNVTESQVCFDGAFQIVVQFRDARERPGLQGLREQGAQHFLLAAAAVEVAGFLTRARIPQRQVAVHVNDAGTGGVQMPVVFILRVKTRIDQTPVCVGAGDGHIHAAERIHDLTEAIELDHGGMVDADAEVVEDRIFQQARSAAGIADGNSMLIGSVDALIFPAGDGYPQITRDRDQRDLSLVRAQDGDDHRIRAEGAARSSVGADQQEVDGLLSIVEDLTARRRQWSKKARRC